MDKSISFASIFAFALCVCVSSLTLDLVKMTLTKNGGYDSIKFIKEKKCSLLKGKQKIFCAKEASHDFFGKRLKTLKELCLKTKAKGR